MTGIIYSPTYDSPELRGTEEIRPWDIMDVVRRFWRPGMTVLDVGCGTCAKTAWMAPESAEFIALDPSPQMREAAQERLRSVGGRTVVLDGTAGAIPLPAASVSHLVCLMAPPDIGEFTRSSPVGRCAFWRFLESSTNAPSKKLSHLTRLGNADR